MKDLKNKITNILGMIVAIGTVLAGALGSVPEDAEWYVYVGGAIVALFGYFTGKDENLKAKKF